MSQLAFGFEDGGSSPGMTIVFQKIDWTRLRAAKSEKAMVRVCRVQQRIDPWYSLNSPIGQNVGVQGMSCAGKKAENNSVAPVVPNVNAHSRFVANHQKTSPLTNQNLCAMMFVILPLIEADLALSALQKQ
ncbi:MAG: hypothetical protein ACYDBJ_26180 [Aggregatilineales bacterium]